MPGAVTVRRWYTCCCWCCCCRCCDVVMFIVGKSKANDWKVVGNKYYLMFIYLVCRHRWYTSCGRCWCCPRLRGWNQSAEIRNSIFLTSLTWSNRFKTIFSPINQIFLREVQIFSGHLICSETVACVLLDTRHKLRPGLGEQDAENENIKQEAMCKWIALKCTEITWHHFYEEASQFDLVWQVFTPKLLDDNKLWICHCR